LVLTIAFAILTYVVSLNVEIGFLRLNSEWISNSFALTVFGGVFTGFFVMFLCEAHKYLHIKKETELLLFTHAGHIYAQLRVIQVTLEGLNRNPEEIVTDNLLNGPVNTLKNEAAFVSDIVFETFMSKNLISQTHSKFKRWLLADYAKFLNNCTYIQIAINTDKIENLKELGREGKITSAAPFTGAAIKKLLEQICPIIQYVDGYISFLDSACKGRFHWPLRKTAIEQAFTLRTEGLNDFIEKGVTP